MGLYTVWLPGTLDYCVWGDGGVGFGVCWFGFDVRVGFVVLIVWLLCVCGLGR